MKILGHYSFPTLVIINLDYNLKEEYGYLLRNFSFRSVNITFESSLP